MPCAALIVISWSIHAAAAPLSIAHRGDSLYAPENTLAAFSSATGKAHLVEFDVRVSADGHLVVMHDSSVNRTTDGIGPVAGLTLAQLKELDAGSWFSPTFAGTRVPTIAEALDAILAAGMTPLVEHKAGAAADYVANLQALGVTADVVVQSFNWPFLGAVHALDPSIRIAALGQGRLQESVISYLQATGADIVAWSYRDVVPADVSLVHGRGMELYVWTVNGEAIIRSFIEMGVDGIITDDPGLVWQLVPEPPAPMLAAMSLLCLTWYVHRPRHGRPVADRIAPR
ncbi:MAG: hypothetical protein A2W31_01900 [Planctomycetes bacterium RBG_16_64_10]|nr:MAG: hypothetical protein A2W31_01900 [Planctomycetes bacterium RBG_16_64_10]